MALRKTPPYPIQTGQEADAIMRAVSDGKSGRHWVNLPEGLSRVHQTPGAPHHVKLIMPSTDMGRPLSDLEGATAQLNADHAQMLLFINSLLSANEPARATVELDDVLTAVGWVPENAQHRIELRGRVWQFIKLIAACRVVGQRTYKQRNKDGQEVETYIDAPPWAIMEAERETPPSLFDPDPVPLSVHLVASQTWARLTMAPELAQWLPGGELLGSIPSGRAAGAWARCIGLALANLWRRKPSHALNGTIKPTRRELLERYHINVGNPEELLAGKHARRAPEYWRAAMLMLVEAKFIANSGEATRTVEDTLQGLSRYWSEEWLNERVEITPGEAMKVAVESRAAALPSGKDGGK